MVIVFLLVVSFVFTSILQLHVSKDGSYTVVLNSDIFFRSSSTGFFSNSIYYSNDGHLGQEGKRGKLILKNKTKSVFTNKNFGDYVETTLEWESEHGVPFITVFREYQEIPAITFHQRFPSGATNTSLHNNGEVISSFPSFEINTKEEINFLTYEHVFSKPHSGSWGEGSSYRGGSMSGPVALYNKKLDGVLISSLSNFMVGSLVRNTANVRSIFASGIQGNVEEIPKNYEYSTLIYANLGSINKLFLGWGDFLLKQFGKKRVRYEDDIFLSHICYWTGDGHYYYVTEPKKNYEQTIIDVYNHVTKELTIPIKGFEFDSWFYYKGVDNGVVLWEPMPDVFPRGMKYVNEQTGLPVSLHSKYFSYINEYEKMNFTFYLHKGCGGIPKDIEVYRYMMKKAKGWGMSLYEQDWLSTASGCVTELHTSATIGREWLMNIGQAAEELDLTVQLCMPHPIFIMQSLEMKTVTMARASDDYCPQLREQWMVGFTSMFYYSLGIMPYKDSFYSTDKLQDGCLWVIFCQELNPLLHTIVAAISGGPVGISDKIGYANEARIKETINGDGEILKLDRPIFPIDQVFINGFNGDTLGYNIWSSYNCISKDVGCFFYFMSVDIPDDFILQVDMIPVDLPFQTEIDQYYALKFEEGASEISELVEFDKDHHLVLKKQENIGEQNKGVIGFEYYFVIPRAKGCKWIFLKEMKKIVVASKQRIENLTCDEKGLSMKIKGVEGMIVRLAFEEVSTKRISYLDCAIKENGLAEVECLETCEC